MSSPRPSDPSYHQQVLDVLAGKTTQAIQMNGAPITIGTSCVYEDFKTPCSSPQPSDNYSTFTSNATFTEDSTFSDYVSNQIKCILEDIDGQEDNPQGIRLVKDQLQTALGILKLTADHDDDDCDDHHVNSTSRHCQTSNGKLSEEDFMTSQESAIQQLIAQNKALLEKQQFQHKRNWGRRGKN